MRYFLQHAHTMYAKAQALSGEDDETRRTTPIQCIEPSIQSAVVREEANKFLFNDLELYEKEGHEEAYPQEDIKKLSNLIQGLGGLFRKVLLSNRSERRVFSIAISDTPSDEVLHILDIGIQLGYFHRSTIGRKESGSIGRTSIGLCKNIEKDIVNIDFLCSYMDGGLIESEESTEVKWVKEQEALEMITFPLVKRRFENMISGKDKALCFSFKRDPFDVVSSNEYIVGKR